MTFNFTSEGGQISGFGIAGLQGAQSPSNPSFSTQVGAGIVNMNAGGPFDAGGLGYRILICSCTAAGTQSIVLPQSNQVAAGLILTIILQSGNQSVKAVDSGGNDVGPDIAQPAGGDVGQGQSYLCVDNSGPNRWISIFSPF